LSNLHAETYAPESATLVRLAQVNGRELMKRAPGASIVVVALMALSAGTGLARGVDAHLFRLTAAMSPRQVVTPDNKRWSAPPAYATARGTFTGSFDARTGRLTWKITFSARARPKLRIVDIHYGPPGRFGAFLARACAGCNSGDHGVVKIKRSAREEIVAGRAWVTLITEDYPNGVIRGQITARKTT